MKSIITTHLHQYKISTSTEGGHKHMMEGYTDYILGINPLHFHVYYGVSSYAGHTHYYSGFTGFPVKTANGHIHRLKGVLEVNARHEHKYNDFTYENIGYTPRKAMKKAYVQ